MPAWAIVETRAVRRRKSAAGDKLVNNYRVLRALGHGRFAKVRLCERLAETSERPEPAGAIDSERLEAAASSLGAPPPQPPPAFAPAAPAPREPPRQFAMKIFSKKALARLKEYVSLPAPAASDGGEGEGEGAPRMRVVTALDRVRDEIAIMRALYHRNVVLLFEVIESDDCDKIYMIMELMAGGPCMAYSPDTKRFASQATRGPLSEALAQAYTRDVLEGLRYLHARGICHRDIKPDNILLNDSGRCHLSDFGCALAVPASGTSAATAMVSDTVGTYQFLAPECCSGELYDAFKVDIWAVGVVLFIFLTGTLPFPADNTKELFEQIATTPIELPLSVQGQVRPECVNLLHRLLTRSPDQRISIVDSLTHPWLAPEVEVDGEPIFF